MWLPAELFMMIKCDDDVVVDVVVIDDDVDGDVDDDDDDDKLPLSFHICQAMVSGVCYNCWFIC